MARHHANCLAVKLTLSAWFEHLHESFSYNEVQFGKFYLPVTTILLPAENVNEVSKKKLESL